MVAVADFETTTLEEDCRVWLWGFSEVEKPGYDDVQWGTTLGGFIEKLYEQNTLCWFHNLRFDGTFIIDWLFNNGYKYAIYEDQFVDGTFKALIDRMGKFYSITVKWKSGNSTEFRDSLKKVPMALASAAKAFKLEMTKGEIDYEANRPIGYIPSEEELDYLRRDVSILAQIMKEVLDSGMTHLTVASDSMHEYKYLSGMAKFNEMFPVLHRSIDEDIRTAYRGGFTYANPKFTGKIVGSGIALDVNSLYPAMMRYKILPYGEPEYIKYGFEPTEEWPLTISLYTISAKIKPGHIPCIQLRHNNAFIETEYLTEVVCEDISLTNIDEQLLRDHYDFEIIATDGTYRFKGKTGMFDDYIDKWTYIKQHSTGGKREIAKLHLNSLYGKFASNPNVTGKMPIFEDGVVKLVEGPEDSRDPVYTAMGVFITSYARDFTIREAQRNYDVFAYCDTDSLHLLCDTIPATIEVHPTEIGKWKHEYDFIMAFYIRAKAYMEQICEDNFHNDECKENCLTRHNFKTAVAGLPVYISGQMNFHDIIDGNVIEGKHHPKTVKGGIVLKKVPYTLKL